MRKVLIVDDETLVRITLHTLIPWEEMGYELADAVHGEQALEYIKEHPVDLVITDMKMPFLDGIGLLKELNRLPGRPKTIALSSYDEYPLVREAFCLGVSDYLLKADLNAKALKAVLLKISREGLNTDSFIAGSEAAPVAPRELLLAAFMGKQPPLEEWLSQDYAIVQFEIDDFARHSLRFSGDLEESLLKPMLDFAGQIPRVASRCILTSISPSRYAMYYKISQREQYPDNLLSTCRQLVNVWGNYMNLPVSAGISRAGRGEKDWFSCFEEAGNQLLLRYLTGRASICRQGDKAQISARTMLDRLERYHRLVQGVQTLNEAVVEEEKKRLFDDLHTMEFKLAKQECLYLICHLAMALKEHGEDFWCMFQEDINYYDKLERIEQASGLEIWMNNYLRWIMDDIEHHQDRKQADLIVRAKRFIRDNYANPELTLGSVAGYVGLNEKYFSTRFAKEEGVTFSNYLAELRIRKAKNLMDKTDLKMYEISLSVGYNNVEHFTRMFKKICHISPSAYKKLKTS